MRNAASPGATGGLSADNGRAGSLPAKVMATRIIAQAKACGSGIEARLSARTEVRGSLRFNAIRVTAFTLLELMMAIVILGLGLVMVATIFPVAWTRARVMSEATARQTIVPTTESTLRGLVPVADTNLTRAGFAGDLVYVSDCSPGWIAAYSDTRVHMLNTQNLRAGGAGKTRGFVAEDPWQLERIPDAGVWITVPLDTYAEDPCKELLDNRSSDRIEEDIKAFSYFTPRVTFGQRWYPPLPPREGVDPDDGEFSGNDDEWDNRFDTRRFAWAVFHRLREPLGPVDSTLLSPPIYDPRSSFYVSDAQKAAKAAGGEREFDIYYVALRRTRSTDRFAKQDFSTSSLIPDPYLLATAPNVTPRAQAHGEDVMLPTPWRVQIEVPQFPNIQLAAESTGVPTEILVPPNNFPGSTPAKVMLVQMFSPGTYLVDEINGLVYKVVKRRIIEVSGEPEEAVLTLDREITLEDLEIPRLPSGLCDPRFPEVDACTTIGPANPKADDEERLRTVWVFPPATEARDEDNSYPTFNGPPPVVSIEIRTLSILP